MTSDANQAEMSLDKLSWEQRAQWVRDLRRQGRVEDLPRLVDSLHSAGIHRPTGVRGLQDRLGVFVHSLAAVAVGFAMMSGFLMMMLCEGVVVFLIAGCAFGWMTTLLALWDIALLVVAGFSTVSYVKYSLLREKDPLLGLAQYAILLGAAVVLTWLLAAAFGIRVAPAEAGASRGAAYTWAGLCYAFIFSAVYVFLLVLIPLQDQFVQGLKVDLEQWTHLYQAAFARQALAAVEEISSRCEQIEPPPVCAACRSRFISAFDSQLGLTYLHCHDCHRVYDGQETLTGLRRLVAVVDQQWQPDELRKDEVLWINALRRAAPFDCDAIELLDANDVDLERFIMSRANDPDEYRRARNATVSCRVGPRCRPSAHTLNLIRHVFPGTMISQKAAATDKGGKIQP